VLLGSLVACRSCWFADCVESLYFNIVAFYPRLFISLWHFIRLSIFRVAFCPGPSGLWHFVLWHFVPWHFVRTPRSWSNWVHGNWRLNLAASSSLVLYEHWPSLNWRNFPLQATSTLSSRYAICNFHTVIFCCFLTSVYLRFMWTFVLLAFVQIPSVQLGSRNYGRHRRVQTANRAKWSVTWGVVIAQKYRSSKQRRHIK